MWRKLQYALLVGSIGLAGADRIDLAAGHGPFILTPFLVLTPLVLVSGFLGTGLLGWLRLKVTPPIRRQVPFLAASSLFLLFSFVSIPFSLDPDRSIVAFLGLTLVAILAYCISVRILEDPALETLVIRSVTLALVMYAFFCIAECFAWTHGVQLDAERSGSWFQSTFAPSTLGPWVPTLSGTTFDNNRSGFVLTMYLVLLDRFAPKSRYAPVLRYVIAFFVFLTLSRSGVLCWLAYYLFSRTFWARLASRRAIIRLAAIAILCSLVCVVYEKELLNLAEAWEISDAVAAKMSVDAGSSGESHILLIQRGFETWLTSTKTIVTGIGFAAAPKVLEDFFGTGKRGNFHCLYVTALAETGFPSFVVLMFILTYPMLNRKGATPGIAALMMFNVTYQSHTEPVFWLTLALLWSAEPRDIPALRHLRLADEFPKGAAITGTS